MRININYAVLFVKFQIDAIDKNRFLAHIKPSSGI